MFKHLTDVATFDTILIAVAGCAVLSLRMTGAAVRRGGRRGGSATRSGTFAFIQETVHVIPSNTKQTVLLQNVYDTQRGLKVDYKTFVTD